VTKKLIDTIPRVNDIKSIYVKAYSNNMKTWGKPYYSSWGRSNCSNGGRPCRSGYNLKLLAT
jgi:hypothetical protein